MDHPSALQGLRRRAVAAAIICGRALISQTAVGVSAILRDEAGRVLLVRSRFVPGWDLPGGGVGAGEAPEAAILRELREEVGLCASGPPALMGLYTRRVVWATNLIALYEISGASIDFQPNFEIRDIFWADPAAPPRGTGVGTRRRLAELTGQRPQAPFW